MTDFREAVRQCAMISSLPALYLTDWVEGGSIKDIPPNSPVWLEATAVGERIRTGETDGKEWLDLQIDKLGLRGEIDKECARLARREKTGRRIYFGMRSIEADQMVTLRAWCRLAKYPTSEVGGKKAFCVGRNASHTFYLVFERGKMFRGACEGGSPSWSEVQPTSSEFKNLRWGTGYIGH